MTKLSFSSGNPEQIIPNLSGLYISCPDTSSHIWLGNLMLMGSCRYDDYNQIEEEEEDTCEHCGAELFADDKYCKHCGGKHIPLKTRLAE